MTRPVYSTNFIEVRSPSYADEYDVPAGNVAVLTHMTFYNGVDESPFTAGLALEVAIDDPAIFVWLINLAGLWVGTYQWSGREVFTTALYVTTGPVVNSFRANGYLLTAT